MGGTPVDGKFIRFTADHIYVNWNQNHKQEMDFMKWLGAMFRERFEHRDWMWVYFYLLSTGSELIVSD